MNNSELNTETLDLIDLKSHRKQQKITVQNVADGMKVSKDFVHYIESGEFDKLGAPTFVRGHITNYCKVMGIQPAPILAQIPGHLLQHQDLKTSDAMGGSPLSHVRRQSNHLGRYAVGTTLLGMLGMSFYFIWDKWSLNEPTRVDSDLAISQNDENKSEDKKITYSSLIPQVSGPKFNDDSSQDSTLEEPVETGVDQSQSNSSEEVMTTDDETTIPGDSSEQQPNLSAVTTEDPVINDDGAPSSYSIVMQFEEQAWVAIKTLDGEHIVQDLLGPGLRAFEVTEPVHFRIGNAEKMQLKINDDVVELAPLTTKNIADFNWPFVPSS